MSHDKGKAAAAEKAVKYVRDGMRVGLGTGSTSAYLITQLIEKCNEGLKIEAIATSNASEEMAKKGGIPLLPKETVTELDLTIDGADEVDPDLRLIKGAGGALLREKIIASMSREMIVIADETKRVDRLGKMPLPVEVVPFCEESTYQQIQGLGLSGTWRKTPTDNGNKIIDLVIPETIHNCEELHTALLLIPGVVETGFFFNLATRAIFGYEDGHTELTGAP